jgi:hypothetical protein
MTFANHVLNFNKGLIIKEALPEHVDVLNPYQNKTAYDLCSRFYHKYYDDKHERIFILGINPGRFGGGITGVPFTDPIKLEVFCGIENTLAKKSELSADFIYKMIEAYGGVEKFYGRFYITAICPLGFTKDGKNLNYYDIKELQASVMNFIVESIQTQLTFGANREVCYCLGEGTNFKFFEKLNKEHQFFKKIIPLPHPRFIMQYKRKQIDEFVKYYVQQFES